MARLNATPAKQTTARRLTKLSEKKEPHTSVRRIFKDRSPTIEAEEDREEQWRIATDAWAKDRSYGFGGRPPLGRNRSQREKKATLAANFNILPDSDGSSDVDEDYKSSTSSAPEEAVKTTVPLKQAHVNSLLLPLSQQPRNRPTQKLETYDYAKENDPIDGEEEENAQPISRHSSNASSRYSPTRRNARQDMEEKEGNLRFLCYRQSQESNSEYEEGDKSFSSLDDFIVSDGEELSYHETSADELEEEEIPKRISPPRPRRRLLRGRRPNPEAELRETLMNPSYKDDLCLEPSLPPTMTIPTSQLKPKPEKSHVKDSKMTKAKVLNLEDSDTDSQLQRDSTAAHTDSPIKKSEASLAVLETPPPSPSKSLLRSPTKGRICIPPTPYRESVDAFWSQDATNDWIDQHSPQKEEKKLEQYLREFEESDGDTNSENMRRPRERQREPKTPSKTALKRAETEKKKADLARKKSFDNKKAQIADDFLKVLDEAVSGGQIQKLAEETGGVRIIWSKTLLTTAGRANWKREKIGKESRTSESGSEPSTLIKQHATIELAERIIDSEDRLINTVAHEYCHLANYMISNIHNNPHGASFKLWGRKCKEALKDHPVYGGRIEVTTKHSYQIDYKYVWSCVDCGQNYGRHSKSIDVAKSRCGACKGLLQQIKPKPRNVSPRKKQPTPPSERCEKKSVEDMAKVFGERPLFEAFFPTADCVPMEQVEDLSILPPEWWRKRRRRLEWFNEDGEMLLKPATSAGHDGVRRTLDKRFDYSIQEPRAEAGLETVMEEERRVFEGMLRSMLAFRPEERATAQQVWHSEWTKGWVLPALEQSRSTSAFLGS
ncbi:hypothetical protein CNMCM8927_008094 [Aspergillus lentulus]|uniref:SprT-like domain-containing protein n=1 Tax=Aspergillus lentulus TaxID=293939 RepID=A0AAN5YM13_ASPLE|nr:hypothetical protein CNMCM8927_008094 [Aspergillus lentulus]